LILSVAEERESQRTRDSFNHEIYERERERERGRRIIKVKNCCTLMAVKTNRTSED
jgi:hypothetical protein